jgi:hypothetical protein
MANLGAELRMFVNLRPGVTFSTKSLEPELAHGVTRKPSGTRSAAAMRSPASAASSAAFGAVVQLPRS